MATRHFEGVGDFFNRHIESVGKLLGGGATLVFLLKLRQGLAYLVERAHLVEGQTHDTALFCERLKNRLANPPHSI